MSKLDGRLIYELESEVFGEIGAEGVHIEWDKEQETIQQNYKDLAKKLNDYLVYGQRSKKD